MPNLLLRKVCSLFIPFILCSYTKTRLVCGSASCGEKHFSLRCCVLIGAEPGALLTGWFLIALVPNESSELPSGAAQLSSAYVGTA